MIRASLGHVSLETTNRYAEIPSRLKERTLERCSPPLEAQAPPLPRQTRCRPTRRSPPGSLSVASYVPHSRSRTSACALGKEPRTCGNIFRSATLDAQPSVGRSEPESRGSRGHQAHRRSEQDTRHRPPRSHRLHRRRPAPLHRAELAGAPALMPAPLAMSGAGRRSAHHARPNGSGHICAIDRKAPPRSHTM